MAATWSPMTVNATATHATRARRSHRPLKEGGGCEARVLIPLPLCPCSLALCATAPLYSTHRLLSVRPRLNKESPTFARWGSDPGIRDGEREAREGTQPYAAAV